MSQDFSDLGFIPSSSGNQKNSSPDDFSDLGFVPSKAAQNQKSEKKMGEIEGALSNFNRAIEGTGLPNAATAFFQGGTNALGNMANFAGNILGRKDNIVNPADFGADTSNLSGSTGNLAGNLASYFIPSSGIGHFAPSVMKAIDAFPQLARGLKSAKDILGGITSKLPGSEIPGAGPVTSNLVKNALGGGAFLASQTPDDRTRGFIEGALGSPVIEGSPVAAQNALQSLARPRATEAEINNVLSALPQELRNQVPIGEMIKSSPLTSIQQNVLSNIPFSGMSKPYEMLNTHIKNEGQNIMGNLLGSSSPQNIPKNIYGAVKNNYENLVAKTDESYSNFRDAAKKDNTLFDSSHLENSIDKKISSLNSDIERNPRRKDEYAPILSALNDYKKTLSGVTPQKEGIILDEFGNKTIIPSSKSQKINNFYLNIKLVLKIKVQDKKTLDKNHHVMTEQ